MRLDLMTWPEAETWIARDPRILVPIGSTEQHGPTGLLGTDALVAEAVALRAGERGGVMVAPTIPVGLAAHHMGFAGSLTLRLPTFLALISDWVDALKTHGLAQVLFINGHGGNTRALKLALEQAGREGPRLDMVNWWDLPPVAEARRALYGAAEGSHATPSEIAITQHLFEAARRAARALEPATAPGGPFRDAKDLRARYPDGRIGSNPALAKPEDGARLLDLAAEAVLERLAQGRAAA